MNREAIVDPEELRAFAYKLKSFSQFVEEQFDGLANAVGRLSDSWRDQEYQHFVDYFRRTNEKLRAFSAKTDEVVPQMLRDAEAAAEIHRSQLTD